MHRYIAWDKVGNLSPESTPQVLPSFEVYTLPVTYSEEVDETIGIPMEVEPLDHTKLEDLGLNTCSHDLFLRSKEIPIVDEPKPQLLPKFSPLDVWVEMHRYIAWDKVGNLSPESTPQVLPSFEVYTLPVTYSEEVDETIGIPMEVEPLDHTKLEDLGLNTCSHDLFLRSKEIPIVDEPKPQLLPKFSPLDVNLGDKRETDPPINPYSPSNFRMKVVEPL
nr:ribonuclease H-like domain-containing protein [Tanacetum cinerariifolium]